MTHPARYLSDTLSLNKTAAVFIPEGRVLAIDSIDQFLAGIEKRAFRMADVSVRNTADALDLVQDAMISLVRRYADKPKDQWRPIFYRILSNAIIDFHRKQNIKNRLFSWLPSPVDGVDDLAPEDNHPDPAAEEGERMLLRDERLERLEAAVADLSSRQQQAFFLRCWEGFDTRETASIMKCSEGSVKTHYSRALGALKSKMGDLYD